MGQKSSEPIHTLAKPEGFVSVASRLAIVIFALVAGVSLLVAFELTRREREAAPFVERPTIRNACPT